MATNKSPTATAESPDVRLLDLDDFEVQEEAEERINNYLASKKLTNQQIQWGKRKCFKRKTSKYKGVSLCRKGGIKYWEARLQIAGKKYYLGKYRDEKEAALAYDKAALIAFGDYALTNQMMFPEDFG